ncbi:DUF4386 domain-containing protein [Actinosynnema sp. NPDC020468]|uniref:DUF4386 domain-containing protein n=1 Tax=Actinosynnema sp. NPDC020468 TaxID=3154488 RepID=UPI0033C2CE33
MTLRHTTAAVLVTAVVAVNTAFTLLGTSFDYPAVLAQDPTDVLRRFHENPAVAWQFALLALSAALLAPAALLTSRLAGGARAAALTGVAAAVVQVIGLLRWPLLVPSLDPADPADVHTFTVLNTVLGNGIGEIGGYLLTAAWTVLTVRALRPGLLNTALAYLAAAGIATGVAIGVEWASKVNFAGYVAWSLWLLWLAVLVVRGRVGARVAVPA